MTTPVETVTADTAMTEAARRLRDARIDALVVLDRDDTVGIVTTTDLSYNLSRLRTKIRRARNASE